MMKYAILSSGREMMDVEELRRSIPAEEFDYQSLLGALKGYERPRDKITALLRGGVIIRVKKGIYVFGQKYARRPFSREVLKLLASEKKVLDYRLVRQSFETDNKAVLIEFSGILKDHGYLAYDIKDGYFGLKFLFQSSVPTMRQPGLYAVPIKIQFFPADPSHIEKRKKDYLKTVVSVRAIAGK